MRINVTEVKYEIDKIYNGNIRLLEETENLSGIEKVLKTGFCRTGMACKLSQALHIPFYKILER